MGKLPYKRRQRHVGQAQVIGKQILPLCQQTLQLLQEHLALGPVSFHRLLRVALGVLVSIQMMFEPLVVRFNQLVHRRITL